MITIPFDLELAKKINNGERNGMIVTDGDNYRVEFVYHYERRISYIFSCIMEEGEGSRDS